MLKDPALISVIVPIYNVSKYLEKCIVSIMNQTYKNIEIILVDDGSSDESGKLCDAFSLKDVRIETIHKTNGGLSDARNAGLDYSHGQYIVFVDGDDYIEENMIYKLYEEMKRGNDLAICNFKKVDENGKLLDERKNVKTEIIGQEQFWHKYYNEDLVYCVVAWNKMYKTELFNNVRYEKNKLREDEFILHRIIDQCKNISCISYTGYNYIQRKGSIMSDKTVKMRIDGMEAYLQRANYFYQKDKPYYGNRTLDYGMLIFVYASVNFKNSDSRKIYFQMYEKYKRFISQNVQVKKGSVKFKIKAEIFAKSFTLYQTWIKMKIRKEVLNR